MNRCIITGAARGIGRAIALRLARNAAPHGGAYIALADQHLAELEPVAAEIRQLGGTALVLGGDLADAAFPARLCAQAVNAFGGLDAVVSNAGFAAPGPLATYDPAMWDRVFAVNTRAPLLLAQAAYPALKTTRGTVLFITSISGSHATPPLGAYSASKAAALMLMRQMAAEWGPEGIRVNALSPGLTLTPGTAAAYTDPEARTLREARVPLRRLAGADDMASVAAFLLGPDAAYVHGAELLVDGGLAHTLMGSLPMGGWGRPAAG